MVSLKDTLSSVKNKNLKENRISNFSDPDNDPEVIRALGKSEIEQEKKLESVAANIQKIGKLFKASKAEAKWSYNGLKNILYVTMKGIKCKSESGKKFTLSILHDPFMGGSSLKIEIDDHEKVSKNVYYSTTELKLILKNKMRAAKAKDEVYAMTIKRNNSDGIKGFQFGYVGDLAPEAKLKERVKQFKVYKEFLEEIL